MTDAPRWATFDCYGTLVDWNRGMLSVMREIAGAEAGELLDAYRTAEPEVEAAHPFRSYREVLAESLGKAAAARGIELKPGQQDTLARTLPGWPVFADVARSLGELRRAGWKLAILSNVDRDLIAGTLKRLPVAFDMVITAEDVLSYKPAHGHWLRFRENSGAVRENWVHVAQGYFHDIVPAQQLGLRSVWINRAAEARDESIAGRVLPSLEGLIEAVQSLVEVPS